MNIEAKAQEYNESWVKLPGYEEAYEISDHGRLWSTKYKRFMRPSVGKNGYYKIIVQKNGERKTCRGNKFDEGKLGPQQGEG
jgi:hypothetical protein